MQLVLAALNESLRSQRPLKALLSRVAVSGLPAHGHLPQGLSAMRHLEQQVLRRG